MSDSLVIDSHELTDWGVKVAGAPAIITEEKRVALQRSGLAVQAGAQTAAPVWTGNLRRSITNVVTQDTATVGTNVPYARTMEFGRRAGARMPPPDAIAGWVTAHGMPIEAAFPVARAIGRRGIVGKRYLTGTLERLRPQIIAEFQAILPRVIARLR